MSDPSASSPPGTLKIYLGYAAGVGKTYAMLTEAQDLKRQSSDVVLGYFEPHGRKDTMALVEGRDYVIPDDIKRMAIPVCAHRVAINTRASLSQRNAEASERILQEILSMIEVPL